MKKDTDLPRYRRPAYMTALCSLLAALGTAAMLASGLIPVLTYCSPMAAGLLLIPVLREYGDGRAWMTWAVTAALSLILCADKEAAFFYLFTGFYPILRRHMDRIAAGWLRFGAKLLFFALALGGMYALLIFVLRLDGVVSEFASAGLWLNLGLYLALTAVMMVYDRAVRGIEMLYLIRLRPRLRLPK